MMSSQQPNIAGMGALSIFPILKPVATSVSAATPQAATHRSPATSNLAAKPGGIDDPALRKLTPQLSYSLPGNKPLGYLY